MRKQPSAMKYIDTNETYATFPLSPPQHTPQPTHFT